MGNLIVGCYVILLHINPSPPQAQIARPAMFRPDRRFVFAHPPLPGCKGEPKPLIRSHEQTRFPLALRRGHPRRALPLPAAAQQLPLSELSRYLNSFRTATSEFTQINPDGKLSTGRLLHPPARARALRIRPARANLVLAAAGSVNVFDARSNQGPTVYPLRRTPLNLILARQCRPDARAHGGAPYAEGPTTVVVAQDPEHPEYGSIRLVFSAGPTNCGNGS
jgi:hypothetical protein